MRQRPEVMCVKSEGTPRDYVRAHMWFHLVGASGDEDAVENRNILAEMMKPAQIAEAQRLAREWKPRSGK